MIGLRASTDPDITVAGRVLAALDTPARFLGADCLVVGATARNILSVAWFDRLPSRATRDVDVAVAVATWEAFERLTEGLTRRGGAHTFSVLVGGAAVEVDVVPYGGSRLPTAASCCQTTICSTCWGSARRSTRPTPSTCPATSRCASPRSPA